MDSRAVTADAAGEQEDHQAALGALIYSWGSAYAIEFYSGVHPEEWVAWRLDGDGSRMSSPMAGGLETMIRADYARKPVPREVCP